MRFKSNCFLFSLYKFFQIPSTREEKNNIFFPFFFFSFSPLRKQLFLLNNLLVSMENRQGGAKLIDKQK